MGRAAVCVWTKQVAGLFRCQCLLPSATYPISPGLPCLGTLWTPPVVPLGAPRSLPETVPATYHGNSCDHPHCSAGLGKRTDPRPERQRKVPTWLFKIPPPTPSKKEIRCLTAKHPGQCGLRSCSCSELGVSWLVCLSYGQKCLWLFSRLLCLLPIDVDECCALRSRARTSLFKIALW